MPAKLFPELGSIAEKEVISSFGRNLYPFDTWTRLQRPLPVGNLSRQNLVLEDNPVVFGAEQLETLSLVIHSWRTNSFRYRVVKRALDVLIVVLLLPVVLPAFAVITLLIKATSPGSVFYRHQRIGRFGRPFYMWKFRSMHTNGGEILSEHLRRDPAAAREWQESQKLRDDPRITGFGKFLRRSSLDELPQLLNVLTGEMSLVGPRPIVSSEVPKYQEAYLFYTSARPGMSGLWQVSGRSDLSYRERIELDSGYVIKWKLLLDCKILCQTAGAVWKARGAV